MFGDPPKAGTVYEGDFVAGNITSQTKAKIGTDAKFLQLPLDQRFRPLGGRWWQRGSPAQGQQGRRGADDLPGLAGGGDDLGQTRRFHLAEQGVDIASYPDETSVQIAQALVDAKTFRFDMSDQAPSAFGGTPGAGEWKILIDFYNNPSDVQGTGERFEAAAAAAYKG